MFCPFTSLLVDGIFKEINHFHVDWRIAPTSIFLSLVSLACGATLGPEQALVRINNCVSGIAG
jgi:H+/Cl- antiporter ClcA